MYQCVHPLLVLDRSVWPTGTIKKMPSRFGMKSRGSSFTAFEDEFDPDLGDVGHLKMDSAAEHAKEAQKLPADFDPFAQGSEADALQPVSTAATGRKHRRTTRYGLPAGPEHCYSRMCARNGEGPMAFTIFK